MGSLINRISTALSHSTVRRDLLLLAISVALVTSPFWAPGALWIDTENQYESKEVIATETGLEYVDEEDVPAGVPISDEIACSGTLVDRSCATERAIVQDGPLETGVASEDIAEDERIQDPPYRFVQIDGTIYRVSFERNESAAGANGAAPVEANLSSAVPSGALHAVSIDADDDDVSSTVVEAAEEGEATTGSSVDVPETPIALDDGTYHRVYLVEEAPEGAESPFVFAVFFGLFLGATLLISLTRKIRINVRYTG